MILRHLFATLILLSSIPVFSQVIWYANPELSYLDSFYALNKEPGEAASAKAMVDSVHGKIWVVNKPIGSKRAEFARSEPRDLTLPRYAPTEGDKKYIGWKMKVSIVGDVTPPDFEVFQLKSYPDGMQNYPIDIEYNAGTLVLEAFDPGTGSQSSRGRDLCSYYLGQDKWAYIVLGIKFSNDADSGYVECWINGEKQDLLYSDANKRAKHRTLDDTGNYFKWGAYKAKVYDYDISNCLDEMRIANTYEEANPYSYEAVSSVSYHKILNDGWSVYPNPATTSLTIDFPNAKHPTIRIFSLSGELVYSKKPKSQSLHVSTQGAFDAGIYCVQLVESDGNACCKIISLLNQ